MNVSSLLQAGGVLTVPLAKALNPQARGPVWVGSVLPSCLQPWGCRRGIGLAVGGEGSRDVGGGDKIVQFMGVR